VHDGRELGLEPRAARGDLGGVGLLVDPTLALPCPFEVLDDVREVGVSALDLRLLERLVEQTTRRPD
jgi:hypothetical protein